MPRRDGRGPMGQGTLTGQGIGKCKGALGRALANGTVLGYGGPMDRNRIGRRGGKGACRGLGISIEDQKDWLEDRLNQINMLMKG